MRSVHQDESSLLVMILFYLFCVKRGFECVARAVFDIHSDGVGDVIRAKNDRALAFVHKSELQSENPKTHLHVT